MVFFQKKRGNWGCPPFAHVRLRFFRQIACHNFVNFPLFSAPVPDAPRALSRVFKVWPFFAPPELDGAFVFSNLHNKSMDIRPDRPPSYSGDGPSPGATARRPLRAWSAGVATSGAAALPPPLLLLLLLLSSFPRASVLRPASTRRRRSLCCCALPAPAVGRSTSW